MKGTYLGRSQPWGCQRHCRYSLSGRPCCWQVNCGCMYGHSDSSYSGRVNSSRTHLPLNTSHPSSSSVFSTFCCCLLTSAYKKAHRVNSAKLIINVTTQKRSVLEEKAPWLGVGVWVNSTGVEKSTACVSALGWSCGRKMKMKSWP